MSDATCPECKGNPLGVLLLDTYSPCSLCTHDARSSVEEHPCGRSGGPSAIPCDREVAGSSPAARPPFESGKIRVVEDESEHDENVRFQRAIEVAERMLPDDDEVAVDLDAMRQERSFAVSQQVRQFDPGHRIYGAQGISQRAAQSDRPAGLNSGKALTLYRDAEVAANARHLLRHGGIKALRDYLAEGGV